MVGVFVLAIFIKTKTCLERTADDGRRKEKRGEHCYSPRRQSLESVYESRSNFLETLTMDKGCPLLAKRRKN